MFLFRNASGRVARLVRSSSARVAVALIVLAGSIAALGSQAHGAGDGPANGYLLSTSTGDVTAFGDFDALELGTLAGIVSMAASADGTAVVLLGVDGTLHSGGTQGALSPLDTSAWIAMAAVPRAPSSATSRSAGSDRDVQFTQMAAL